MSDKVYVGNRVGSLEVGESFEPISRVTFYVDDDHFYTAGDDTGRHLEYSMPWATQEMVDNVLKNLYGFVYKPFKATDAMIDPAAELGDGVTVGGEYFMLAQMDTVFDAKCASTIGAPGEKEIDHEYPYLDPTERELKRRVKLGQKYQGVSITRRDGLTIVEVQENGGAGAKVVLNSKELSFYDAGGGRVLYFDPASGTYKFLGELNINDKFVVDKQGNVTMKGSINLSDGAITWGGQGPVKYQFSVNGTSGWHNIMQTNDKYRRDSLDGGTTWGDVYQFRGTDGRPGSDGSDGKDGDPKKYLEEIGITELADSLVKSPWIKGGLVEGGELRVNGSVTSSAMDKSELGVYDEAGDKYGYIRFDDTGSGGPYEAQYRMFIATERGKAMKIQSGGNMSIDAGEKGTIYMASNVVFAKPPKMYFVLA